jgi:TolB-like protein/tRNA A-37 threonylcarbamoyl transferase component Bud32
MSDISEQLQTALTETHTIERELIGGGMSRVFLARDIALGRRVVIKVLPHELAQAVSADRFRREIMLSAALQHPNIVPVLSAGQVDELPYFIMPFVEGESLRARLARGPLSVREVVGILRDLARALSYAHGRGVIHRDIKPDNALLSGGATVVTDFGVAKAISVSRHRQGTSDPQVSQRSITHVGTSLGTPAYMSPEQAAADPATDHRADLYALGIVGYEMLAGTPPFHGRTPQALLTAQLTERPAPISARRYDVPAPLAELLMKCLEKDPAMRPRTAAEVLRVLENPDVISGAFDSQRPGRRASVRSRNVRIGLGLLAVAIVAAAFLTFRTMAPPPVPAPGGVARAASRAVVRLVVLPLDIPPGDTLSSAVGEGVRANLLRLFSRVPAIQVATRDASQGGSGDSAAQHAGAALPVRQLEGSIQRSGKRVRVTFRLVSADQSVTSWSEMYERNVADVFATQDEIARLVADTISAQLVAHKDSVRKAGP